MNRQRIRKSSLLFLTLAILMASMAGIIRLVTLTSKKYQQQQCQYEFYQLMQQACCDQAEKVLQKAEEKFPEWQELSLMKGIFIYHQAKQDTNVDTQLEHYRQSYQWFCKYAKDREVQNHPESLAKAYYWMANAQAAAGCYEQAYSYYAQAWEIYHDFRPAQQAQQALGLHIQNLVQQSQTQQGNVQKKLSAFVAQLRHHLSQYDEVLGTLQHHAPDSFCPPYSDMEMGAIQKNFWKDRLPHSQFPLAMMRDPQIEKLRWTTTWICQQSKGEANNQNLRLAVLPAALKQTVKELKAWQQSLPREQLVHPMTQEAIQKIENALYKLETFIKEPNATLQNLLGYDDLAEAAIALIIPPPQPPPPPRPLTSPPPILPSWKREDMKKQEKTKQIKQPPGTLPGW